MKLLKTITALLSLSAVLLISSAADAAKETFDRTKPPITIAASINGVSIGNITALRGVSIEATDDSSNQTGRPKYGNITFEQAYTGGPNDNDLIQWVTQASIAGEKCRDCRRDILVSVVGPTGEIVNTINLIDTFPLHFEIKTDSSGHVTVLKISFTFIPSRIEFKKA